MSKLIPVEHQNQRVLTTAQLAESFGTDGEYISRNFNNNKDRYSEGKHFYLLEGDALREYKTTTGKNDGSLLRVNRLYLWTEKGAWMHAKSLNTDQAWSAYEMLVDDYYAVKTDQIDVSRLGPEMQMFQQIWQGVARAQLEAQEAQRGISQMKEALVTVQETLLRRDEDWRRKINGLLNGASKRSGDGYQDMRNRSYDLLEERAKCKLSIRLTNLRDRLNEQGATKTKINQTNRMDVIESDPRLKEIYDSIVRELAVGTLSLT